MISVKEVCDTIDALENGVINLQTCSKLATLYLVRDELNKREFGANTSLRGVIKEEGDILPEYLKYVDLKYKYQMGEINSEVVKNQMRNVCKEIKEFVQTLYRCSDMVEEREQLVTMLQELQKIEG